MNTTYQFLSAWITSRIDDERGASLVEYALLVALIAVVCLAAVTATRMSRFRTSTSAGCRRCFGVNCEDWGGASTAA